MEIRESSLLLKNKIEKMLGLPSSSKSIDNSNSNSNSKKKMKMETPLPPHQQKSSALLLIPSAKQRVDLTLDKAVEYELKYGRKLDLNLDTKKIRRMVSNRLSAQRSRMRRSQYIDDLEKMVEGLEETISVLTSQVKSFKEKRKEQLLQYDSLQKLIEIRSSRSKICEIELEQKRLEICRLKELGKTWSISSYHFNYGAEQMLHLMKFNPSTSQPSPMQDLRRKK